MFKNIPPKVTSHRVGVALNMIKGHCDYLIRSAAGSDRRAQNFINLVCSVLSTAGLLC